MIGKTISHYTILEHLGSGGMGVVYKARDLKLDRTVALKFLPPELTSDLETRRRFVHEAKAASGLDHPNICTIHDIGEAEEGRTFIVMAYYEGETLKQRLTRGPLESAEAIDIAIQIVSGLTQAHERGIVHRDIKPANIILTSDGTATIVDFGLAKLSGVDLSRSTSGKGTIAYMCPEQIRGHTVDQRCDLWALGVVLYEMLSGCLPFKGEYAEPLMYSVVNEEPLPLVHARSDVPDELRTIVDRLLRKDLAERYQSGSELLTDLQSLAERRGTRAAAQRPGILRRRRPGKRFAYGAAAVLALALLLSLGWSSIFPERGRGNLVIVLPATNISESAEQEWFADAMTDALTTQLAQVSGLRVISLSTAMKYRGTQKTPPAIADELGVDYLVEASSSPAGERIDLSVRLVDPTVDEYVWAKTYKSAPRAVFLLVGEIAQAIAAELGADLTSEERRRFARLRAVDPEAYELCLKGNAHLNMFTKEETEAATVCFEKALEVDSSCAQAHVGLLYCYGFYTYWGAVPREEGLAKIRGAIASALALDEGLAEAYQGLGAFRLWQLWDWEGAGTAFERAVELNPNLPGIMGTEYAWYLMTMGRHEESIVEAERLLKLDPLSHAARNTAFSAYYRAREYQKAIDISRRSIQLLAANERYYWDLAAAQERSGSFDDAHRSRLEALSVSGIAAGEVARYDSLYRAMGPEAYPRWLILRAEGEPLTSRYDLLTAAWIHARLGETGRALDHLDEAYRAREGGLAGIKTDPRWDMLRQDARFEELLERMGFPG